eukprot:727232-Hanusia_phi.AAC.2
MKRSCTREEERGVWRGEDSEGGGKLRERAEGEGRKEGGERKAGMTIVQQGSVQLSSSPCGGRRSTGWGGAALLGQLRLSLLAVLQQLEGDDR